MYVYVCVCVCSLSIGRVMCTARASSGARSLLHTVLRAFSHESRSLFLILFFYFLSLYRYDACLSVVYNVRSNQNIIVQKTNHSAIYIYGQNTSLYICTYMYLRIYVCKFYTYSPKCNQIFLINYHTYIILVVGFILYYNIIII